MKFDDLLAQYLYEKKTLQLQGIGTFELDQAVSLPQPQEKEIYYPIEGLTFTYNTKDVTNEDLITFLVKKLGKIMPLVRSDLDSYLSNIKQFINIGKPYTIEGIGTLHKNNQGTYEFTPGNFLPMKEELSPKRAKSEHSIRRDEAKSTAARKNIAITLIVLASIAVLGGLGWGIYKFVYKGEPVVESMDSTQNNLPAETQNDTSNINTIPPVTTTVGTDSVDYKMIFEVTNSRLRAYKRTNTLIKYKMPAELDSLGSAGNRRFILYIPMRILPSDTTRIKDSLARIFVRRIIVAQ